MQPTLQERIQAFKQGTGTLQKADLVDLKTGVEAVAPQAGRPLQAILDAFDRIDQNQDGISAQELAQFAGAKAPPARPGPADGPPPRGVGGGGLPVMVVMMSQGGASPTVATGTPQGGGEPKAVSKEDLLNLKDLLEKAGLNVPEELQTLIDSFDRLDADRSGTLSLPEVREAMKDQPLPAQPPAEALSGSRAAGRAGGSLGAQLKDLLARVGQALASALAAAEGPSVDGRETAGAPGGAPVEAAPGQMEEQQGSVRFSLRASVSEVSAQARRAYGQTTAVSYAAEASVSMVDLKV
ncbi:MAG: hypothetical protein OZSIB_4116 [Candidatus Ozemobacter sibiricus]|uniref:EF-hand domain-containing protein n=1 Tax=Candidatus Ozemobacter sibiricus TaxID=2268124 RepID=A0A367ZND7_9BACT|nr:MAG: hypothetical protein OZSIB_4116 [Candidatus Ozemobacter sibiricus]